MIQEKKVNITVVISTCNRYDSLLLCLNSLIYQTYIPSEILIYDDTPEEDWEDCRDDILFQHFFNVCQRLTIKWHVHRGSEKGQVANHIRSLEDASHYWIFRVDDDCYVESDVIKRLVETSNDDSHNAGLVAPVVLHPNIQFHEKATSPSIKDVKCHYACQFAGFDGIKKVEHCYSTFMFNKDYAKDCYPTNLSRVGHREETIFSYNIFKKGYELLVLGDVYVWHYKNNSGGIRSYRNAELWKSDERIFDEYLEKWEVTLNDHRIMYIRGGIGDNYMARHTLDKAMKKYPKSKFIVATVYEDVYKDIEDDRVSTCDLETGKILMRKGDYECQRLDAYGVLKAGIKSVKNPRDAFDYVYFKTLKW
jgi:GT2 family glycosyltransferase